MKRLTIVLSFVSFLSATTALAQVAPTVPRSKPVTPRKTAAVPPPRPAEPPVSPGEMTTMTPEMWFYQQAMRRYDDPKNYVRQKAEYHTAQRLQRMAALKWYGFSNSRPTAVIDPIDSPFSPGWVSNSYYPNRWVAAGYPWYLYPTPSIVVVDRNHGASAAVLPGSAPAVQESVSGLVPAEPQSAGRSASQSRR